MPKGLHFLKGQIVDIRRRAQQSPLDQGIHDGAAQAFNVHCVPADEVGDIPAELRRTLRTGAAQEGTFRIPFSFCAAYRTVAGQEISNGIRRPLCKIDFQNFRNDLTRLANQHRVANADIPLGNEVLIVKCGVGNRRTRQTDGTHHSLGGQYAGTAHLHHDILHHRGFDLRRILVCHCPLGELGCCTQSLPLGKVVDLDDSAIDVAAQCLTVFVDGHDMIHDGIG